MKIKKIITVLLCVLLVGGGVFIMFSAISLNKYKNDELESCSVSTGGGMLGGYRNVKLDRNKDGEAVLKVQTKEMHSSREITTTYKVDEEAFLNVRDLVNRYGLYAASKMPYSKMQVLDGDTTNLSFDYSKGYFGISENQVLSKKMSKGFREVITYLESLASGEGITEVEAQTAVLYLKSGYTLQFIVEDAFDGKLDDILGTEHEVSVFADHGIVLCSGEEPDLSLAQPSDAAGPGTIVYDVESGNIIILYADHTFSGPVYILARLDGYVDSACPLIEKMEGGYSLNLN